MLEVIVFALVLVMAQLAVTVALTCLALSNWFTKKMMRKTMDLTKTVVDEMEKMGDDWL